MRDPICGRRRGLTGAVALATALVALVAAASAGAVREVGVTETSRGTHSVTATCPDPYHVVSGGGATGLITNATAPLVTSRKSGNGWKVKGDSLGDTAHSFFVTAYTYCSLHDLNLSSFSGKRTGTPRVSARTACGSRDIVSGGGEVTSPHGVVIANEKAGDGWLFGADTTYEGGGSAAATAKAFAYCTHRNFDLEVAQASGRAHAGQLKSRTAHCPEGTHVVSGGGDVGRSHRTFIWYDRKQGNGWRIIATNHGTSRTRITAFAYCRG